MLYFYLNPSVFSTKDVMLCGRTLFNSGVEHKAAKAHCIMQWEVTLQQNKPLRGPVARHWPDLRNARAQAL